MAITADNRAGFGVQVDAEIAELNRQRVDLLKARLSDAGAVGKFDVNTAIPHILIPLGRASRAAEREQAGTLIAADFSRFLEDINIGMTGYAEQPFTTTSSRPGEYKYTIHDGGTEKPVAEVAIRQDLISIWMLNPEEPKKAKERDGTKTIQNYTLWKYAQRFGNEVESDTPHKRVVSLIG